MDSSCTYSRAADGSWVRTHNCKEGGAKTCPPVPQGDIVAIEAAIKNAMGSAFALAAQDELVYECSPPAVAADGNRIWFVRAGEVKKVFKRGSGTSFVEVAGNPSPPPVGPVVGAGH